MNRKVLLILADGFRPDALAACGHPFADRLLSLGSYCLNTLTVWPSVTLPCHMSLFHSVSPDRHGILTNTYVPQVRPVNGLCEQLKAAGKTSAFFYDWEELRDLSRPASLSYSFFASGSTFTYQKADHGKRACLSGKGIAGFRFRLSRPHRQRRPRFRLDGNRISGSLQAVHGRNAASGGPF